MESSHEPGIRGARNQAADIDVTNTLVNTGPEAVGQTASRQVPIHIITPVWGTEYTRSFVDIALPSLLAEGNIPVLQDMPGSRYNIYTSDEDRRTIEASPAYQTLLRYVPVSFHPIRAVRDRIENQYVVQSDSYRRGIREADAADAAMLFINADIVVANGGVSSLVAALQSGKRAVMALGYRVNGPAVAASLVERFRSADVSTITIAPRDLVALSLPNLHPISKAHLVHGEGEGLHPAGLFWRVGENGLLAHCFHLHPVLVYPEKKQASFSTTIDEDYLNSACPNSDDIHIVGDSDQFCACELSDPNRRIGTMPRTGDRSDLARWAFFNANRKHRELVQFPIRIHGTEIDPSTWGPIEEEADSLVRRILVDLGDPRLFSEHRASDYSSAAPSSRYLPLKFVTPVWGKEYSETFARVTLPTILSLGNIPAVPNKEDCHYTIYADAIGREIIEGSAAYAILREHVKTEFRPIPEDISNRYVASSRCYRDIVEEAARQSAAAVFLIPDMILADGSIRFLANVLRSGKRQILITGIRLIKETAVPELLQHHAAGGVITIGAQDLTRLALSNLHPITESHMFEGDSDYFHPAGMYWRVGNQGFVLRCFHLHPVAIVPQRGSEQFTGTIDDDLMESSSFYDKDVYVVTNSDDMQWCEISKASRTVPTPPRAGIGGILEWMENNASTFHRSLINSTIRVHTGSPTGPEWDAVEARADAVVRTALGLYEERLTERLRDQANRNAAHALPPPEKPLKAIVLDIFGIAMQAASVGAQILRLAERRFRKPVFGSEFPASLVYFCVSAVFVVGFLPLRVLVRIRRRLACGAGATSSDAGRASGASDLAKVDTDAPGKS